MRISWHVVAKLLIVSRMSKVDYQNKVYNLNLNSINLNPIKSAVKLIKNVYNQIWNRLCTQKIQWQKPLCGDGLGVF